MGWVVLVGAVVAAAVVGARLWSRRADAGPAEPELPRARIRTVESWPAQTFRFGPDLGTEGERIETYCLGGTELGPVNLEPATEPGRYAFRYELELPRDGWLGIELRPPHEVPEGFNGFALLFRADDVKASLCVALEAGGHKWSWQDLFVLERTDWTLVEVPYEAFADDDGAPPPAGVRIDQIRLEINYFFGGGGPGLVHKSLTLDSVGLVSLLEGEEAGAPGAGTAGAPAPGDPQSSADA